MKIYSRVIAVALIFFILLLRFSIFPVFAQGSAEQGTTGQGAAVALPAPLSVASDQTVQDKKDLDITQQTTEVKSKLAAYLESAPAQPLSPINFIQHGIRAAVKNGIPANLLVLLLLFPVTASLIAIFRHIIGLRGFGVYTPAVLAVAFVSTGLVKGLLLFSVVFITTTLGKTLVSRLKLQYLPRTALMLWFVSLVIFAVLILAPHVWSLDIVSVGIFPMLVLILLSENFLEAQLSGSLRRALQLTFETIVLAVLSAVFMRTLVVQKFVITYPELTILLVCVVDIVVGKYTGLRVSEYFRFKPMIEPEE